jgi:tetratricopeptide (TPR) repeat protein
MSRIRQCILGLAASSFLGLGGIHSVVEAGWFTGTAGLLVLWQGMETARGSEADTNAAPAIAANTNSEEMLRVYLQLQEQLHAAQLAIEQNRKEARDTATQNSEMLAGKFQVIEKALEAQRTRELETMQSSNRAVLLVAGTFASVGFLAILLMSFFQWRTVGRLAQISTALPVSLGFGASAGRTALSPSDTHLLTVGPAEQSNARLLGSLEQLEKRIHELEHTTRPPLEEGISATNGDSPSQSRTTENGVTQAEPNHQSSPAAANGVENDLVGVLLGKGQAMLNLDDAQAAAACFDEALAIAPNNAEAWIRKGTALERLQQLDAAVQCYDRAIAADDSMTVAYLHKGGLFNRMERFNEALECYERALRTQEKRHA